MVMHPLGQWWGGRSVPMVGIGGVAVDPADRADGGATWLMQEVVRELHRVGVALSTLFPATQPLYRRAGYEQAGLHYRIRVNTQRLFTSERALPLRRATEADRPQIERLHRADGRDNDGNIDRSELYWSFLREPTDATPQTFVVEEEGEVSGYVFYTSQTNASDHQDLFLSDIVARTPATARRLLTFLRDHRSLVDFVKWRGSPTDPLLLQAREQRHDIRIWDIWMLRVVDVRQALEMRGYPVGVQAEIHWDVSDSLCPENEGRFVLSVAGGRGTVQSGGEGRVPLDVRTLAPLYAGYASAQQLRTGGDLACGDEDAARIAAVFAGPQPWMQDGF